MPQYNRGPCACCATHVCNPVSFTFVDLQIRYQYSMMGSTWYTDCAITSAIIEVTHLDGVVEQVDASASITFNSHYASRTKHNDNQGGVTFCGKTAQWRVVFNIPADSWDYPATLSDATTIETSRFQ